MPLEVIEFFGQFAGDDNAINKDEYNKARDHAMIKGLKPPGDNKDDPMNFMMKLGEKVESFTKDGRTTLTPENFAELRNMLKEYGEKTNQEKEFFTRLEKVDSIGRFTGFYYRIMDEITMSKGG